MLALSRGLFFAAAFTTVVLSRDAVACAVCGAGDPTVATVGAERPYLGRLRASAEARYGSVSVGEGSDAIAVHEARLDLTVAWSPSDTVLLCAALPLLHRVARSADGAEAPTNSLGDAELRAKIVFWSRDTASTRHQAAFITGVKLPTAPETDDASGAPLPAELQPGTGSVAPFAGLAYIYRQGAWSSFVGATLYLPLAVRSGPRACDSFRTSFAVQYQHLKWLAPRFGLSTRIDSSGDANDPHASDSGGFVGYVSSEVISAPITDLVFTLGAYFPVIQALHGVQREGTLVSAGVLVDLG